MKYEISIYMIFQYKTNAKSLFEFLDSKRSEASPELRDNVSLTSTFDQTYIVSGALRLDTQDQRDEIITQIQNQKGEGVIKYHDCYHDEGGPCLNQKSIIIGEYIESN